MPAVSIPDVLLRHKTQCDYVRMLQAADMLSKMRPDMMTIKVTMTQQQQYTVVHTCAMIAILNPD